MKALNEKVEKVKKEYEELRKAEEKAFSDSFKTRVAGIQKEIGDLTGDFERLIKQTNDFTAALNGLRGAQNQGGILALEVEKMNALLAAHGEAERQAIEQTYALKIAMEKAAIAQEEGALKIEAANAAIE
jgi:phage host-nuclease inhibitor protein Gam